MIDFLYPNAVYAEREKRYRLLQHLGSACVFIDIDDERAMPFKVDESRIDSDWSLTKIEDPWLEHSRRTYSSEHRDIKLRDKNYERVKGLIKNDQYFDKNARSAVMDLLVAQGEGARSTLYRYARRFWQRGQNSNALLPDYKYCGGKGKDKNRKGKPLGRPKKYGDVPNEPWSKELESMMYSAIQCTILSGRYLIDKKGKSKNVHDINAAYTELLARYCQGNVEKLDSSKPSKATLKHYYNTKFTPERKAQAKYGERYFNANVRPLTSSVREWLVGSGYSYSIDSTPFDAGVAGEDRFPLARPVLYEVTDDYSSATVGFLLVLTPASYFNALNAMTVAISNKRELCIKYGLSIQHDEWPMEGLPKAFFGDLGSEFKTNKIEKLAEIHNVSMKNSGAGQPDKRSVGERSFGRVYNEIKHLIPGLVSQYIPKKAGGLYKPENYTLFLDELNKVLVLAVLSLNSKPLNGWDGDEDFPADLSTTPNNIWRWSIAHRTGPLARVDKDYFWFSMLPREDATVSKNNILTLDNIKFNCPNTTGLRVKSYNNRQKMTVVRDPSDASAIFLVPPDGESEYVRCELTPHYRRFKGLPWKDAKEAYEQRQYANANGQHDYEKLRVNVRQDTLNIVEEAEREREESIGNLTKSDQLAHLGDKSKQRENSQQIYGAIKPVPPLSKKDKLTEFELDKSPVIDSRTINFMEDED